MSTYCMLHFGSIDVGTYITFMNGVYRALFTTQFFVLMDFKMKYWHSTLDPTKTRTHLT